MPTNRALRPLHIAFPFSDLRIGGAELRAMRLVERLPRDRFECVFLSSSGEGEMDASARAAGAYVTYLGGRPLGNARLPTKAVGRFVKWARYAVHARASGFDIVNAWLYPSDVYVALARPVTRTPVIISGRFDLLPRQAFGPFSAKVDEIVNSRVDAIVANSEVVARQVRGRRGVDPLKLHVIRNGVAVTTPASADERRRVRAELGAGEDDILIGAVGMLREVKRHDLLIDAFADVARSRNGVRLAIIGEGSMRVPLESQVRQLGLESLVRLPGAFAEVRPLLGAFDIVALSSRSEGLPNALLEAAAAGKPIVTSAAGGATEVVDDGVTGLVVPIEDRVALSQGLSRLVSDASMRERYGAAARMHIETSFGMDRFVREWTELYERLAIERGLIEA